MRDKKGTGDDVRGNVLKLLGEMVLEQWHNRSATYIKIESDQRISPNLKVLLTVHHSISV
jgi:hypothetical protein